MLPTPGVSLAPNRGRLALTLGAVLMSVAVAVVLAVPTAAGASTAGDLYAFGLNNRGQLGSATSNGTSNPNPTPALVSLPGATGAVVKVAAGAYHSLAVTSTGQLYAFGYNSDGELGRATNSGTENPNPTPALVSLPGATGTVVQVAAGGYHSLALTSAGQLYAFGYNRYGQLGTATNSGTFNPNPTPFLVTLPGATGPVVQIAAGEYHSLAVTSTGQLYAFGYNRHGQLGDATNNGTEGPNPTPALVSLPGATGPVVQVAAGYDDSLAVTSTGQLYAFGGNRYGQLGNATNNGSDNPNPRPELVSLPGATGPVVQVAAGGSHSLAVTSTGQLYAFGHNSYGQLGNATNSGSDNPNPTPVLVSLPGATAPVVRVAAGYEDSLAVTSTGQLYAFGLNTFGQLGSATNNGTGNPNPTPAPVSLPGGVTIDTVAPSPAAYHSLAVVADLAVATGSLPGGTVGVPYSARLKASGGAPPYRWSASGLPAGLKIDPAGGAISGTPDQAGGARVQVTVTDSDGITASSTLQLSITPPPSLSALTVSPRRVPLVGRRVNGRCVKPTKTNNRSRHCRLPIRLRISYTLNLAATVTFTLKRQAPGRKVNGRCVKPTSKNRKHKTCTRLVAVRGTIVQNGNTGSNHFTFKGKIGGQTLGPGTYQLDAAPTGGKAKKATFSILP